MKLYIAPHQRQAIADNARETCRGKTSCRNAERNPCG